MISEVFLALQVQVKYKGLGQHSAWRIKEKIDQVKEDFSIRLKWMPDKLLNVQIDI